MSIGFGIAGLGMGHSRAGLVTRTDGARLIAVCDLNEDRLKKSCNEFRCQGYSDFEEMLKNDNIDVIYIMTPSGTHLDFAKKAARTGKHIITTKPMEITLKRCEEFIDTCKKYEVELVVDFEMRYNSHHQQLKVTIDSGELSEIIFAEARCKWWKTQEYYYAGGWRGTWKYDGGGSAANQGIHVIDLFTWLCGDSEQILFAKYGVLAHDIETEDLTIAVVQLASGRYGSIVTTTNHHLGDEYGVSISFSGGSISNLRGELKIKKKDGSESLNTQIPPLPSSAAEDMVWVLTRNCKPFVSGQ